MVMKYQKHNSTILITKQEKNLFPANKTMIRSPYYGIYEIFGIQRKSYKTTLMTALTISRLMDLDIYTLEPKNSLVSGQSGGTYKPSDIICNYPIFVEGIKPLDNEHWLWEVDESKRTKAYHKLILGDELNSILLCRNTRDMTQAQFAVYVWQMPKMDTILIWTNNQITGVDVIIRDGTWNTIMPTGEPETNSIKFNVIHNYGTRVNRNLRFNDVKRIQELFDSYAPVT